jgi:ABC-2 type transport system ATP-binding protein
LVLKGVENMDLAIKTTNLIKKFGSNTVINCSNMNVSRGSIYGFLGANGAGKTTIFKLIIGLLKPTLGTIEILGEDITKSNNNILRKVGALIEVPIFYEHLSAMENLEIHLNYMGVREGINSSEALHMVGLKDVGNKPVSKFSLGMRQRLAIARAIIHNPEILILDEPLNGLDPIGIKEMRELFLNLTQNKEMTILLSSHILSELQYIVDTVGVIVNGTIVEEVKLEEINSKYNKSLEEYFFNIMSGGNKLC